jgi:DNA-binding beta-propeller fold protein YncE
VRLRANDDLVTAQDSGVVMDMSAYGSTRGLALGLVLAVVVAAGAWIAVFGDFNGDSGGLTQQAGRAGCLSADGTGGFSDAATEGECALAPAVGLPTALVLSPDGRNAYVAAHREAVAVLDRDPRSGVLAAKRGQGGCLSRDGTPGGERTRRLHGGSAFGRERSCVTGRALFGVTDVALSPDGRNAYVGSVEGLAILDRDRRGALKQKRGASGCLTRTGTTRGRAAGRGTCARATGLYGVSSVTVSPDGLTVYVTSVDVLAFARDARTGALTQIRGRAGCVAATRAGEGGRDCVADPAVEGATSLTVSPDGRQVYAASGTDAGAAGAVAILARDRSTGALTPLPGRRGCVSAATGCAHARGLRGAAAVATSPDGANAYVVSYLGCAIAVFDRDAASGALVQKRGGAGSATRHGDSGACENRGAGQVTGFAGGAAALSPDGRTVFVTARAGVAMYARAPGGTLRYRGCVSDDGEGTCEDVKALNVPIAAVVSPDGRNLYVAASGGDAIAAFDLPGRAGGG